MKVFDHIDFNKFFEENIKFDITQPTIKKELCIGEVYLEELMLLEMAQGITPGSSTRSAIRLDDDDIEYLYQFLPHDWSRALWWRYGPGLISYARQRHMHIEESVDDEPTSNFHGVNKKGIPVPEEKPESIVFDEGILLGRDIKGEKSLKGDPSLGDHEGKAKLGWMKPEDGFKHHHHLVTGDQKITGKTKYENINFGWNKLYHKLNLKYKFAMQRVDDSAWKEKGTLPNLAGYKPMNFKGADGQWNQYFKAMGMPNHHPENYHDSLKAHQQGMGQMRGQSPQEIADGHTSNDHITPHEIVPLAHGTQNDGQWGKGIPAGQHQAAIDPETDQPVPLQGQAYQDHMYEIMSKGLSTDHRAVKYTAAKHQVQPFYVGSPKKGKYPTYNAYETFGLHKSMKNQEWELEKYFPEEFHTQAFDKMKTDSEAGKVLIGEKAVKDLSFNELRFKIDDSGNFPEQNLIDAFNEKMDDPKNPYRYNWKPLGAVSEEEKANYAGEIRTDHQGHSYIKQKDKFFEYAQGKGGAKNLLKWEYLFLSRYLSRNDSNKSKNLTSNQHSIVTSTYKTISADDINKTIDAHPELGMLHSARDHKRGLNTADDRRDRWIHDKAGGVSGSKKGGGPKHSKTKKGIVLSLNYQKFLDKESPSSSERTKDEDLPLANHTDVMVGGVAHKFGGEGGHIKEFNPATKQWEPIPQQKIFVPLLHRGQVLPSEKQFGKGINIGSFGHSQSSEVETNHFGNDADDDEFPVSKHIAEEYGFPTNDSLSFRIMELKKKGDKSPKEIEDHDKYEKMHAEKGELYFINRNKYFWAVAEKGEQPSEEFFSSKDADHNDVTRNTDHHKDHMKEDDEEDRVLYYDPSIDIGGGKAHAEPGTNLVPVLKSIKDGVYNALKKIKGQKNSDLLYEEMRSRLTTLWQYGEQLLRANVSHPQFFKNDVYESHLKKNEEDLPTDADGNLDPEAARKTGQKAEHTSATGFGYRRMRVANYIRSFSQKGFGENIPYRRGREGQTEGFTRQVEEHDLNRIVRNRVDQRDQYEIAEKRKKGEHVAGVKEDWELPSAQSSFHRRIKKYAEAKEDADKKFNLKGGEEMVKLESDARDGNLALLTLWAIQQGLVPRAREIAQLTHSGEGMEQLNIPSEVASRLPIRNPVSKEVALSPEFGNSKEYKEAHMKQFKLAWAWAQSQIKTDWSERLQKGEQTGTGWYDGITSIINDKKFMDFHKDKDPIDELFERSANYDDKASFDLVKSDSDFKSSGLAQTVEAKKYRDMITEMENAMPNGLFDSERLEGALGVFDPIFKGEIERSEENTVTLAKALYDHLLDSVNPHNVQSKEGWTQKLEDRLKSNAFMFTDILESSSFGEVKQIASKFFAEFSHRVEAVKNSYKRSLSRQISSSAGSQSNAGRSAALQDYDATMDGAKTDEQKTAIVGKKKQYQDTWETFSNLFNKASFDHSFSQGLATSLAKVLEAAPEFEKDYKQAFEDAYVDSLVDFLNHEDNWFDGMLRDVKNMTQFLAEESKLSKHFKKDAKNEAERARDRHTNTIKIHGKRA